MTKLSTLLGRAKIKVRKHSPELLIASGVASSAGALFMACRATLKIDDVLAERDEDMNKIEAALEDERVSEDRYSEDDAIKDRKICYIQTGVKLAKLYVPAALLEIISLACFFTAHGIMKKRNAALSVAYASLTKIYEGYRKRVAEKYGDDAEKEIHYGLKAKEIRSETVDENGKKKKIKETVKVGDGSLPSPYARFFDEASREWSKDPNRNMMFLRAQQRFANDRIRARASYSPDGKGYLFLNEVYDALDIPRSQEGQSVGWIYDPDDNIELNDNYIDFGIFDYHNEAKRDFLDGYERNILLDFNVYGDIVQFL